MPDAPLALEIVEQAGDWSALDAERLLAPVPAAICAEEAVSGLVTVVLADDETLRELNSRFRGKDKATNVLSFPASSVGVVGDDPHLGDVIVSLQTLRREAAEQGKTLEHHFIHLVTHGILHVLGHDHVEEDEAERMEATEIAILSGLGLPDPYAEMERDALPSS